jgi:hypothetical protein
MEAAGKLQRLAPGVGHLVAVIKDDLGAPAADPGRDQRIARAILPQRSLVPCAASAATTLAGLVAETVSTLSGAAAAASTHEAASAKRQHTKQWREV